MTTLSALFIWAALANHGFAAHQRGFAGLCFRSQQCRLDGDGIMAVHARNDMPPVGFKTLRRVVSEPSLHLTVDGDAVVIVDGNQFAQTQRARQ